MCLRMVMLFYIYIEKGGKNDRYILPVWEYIKIKNALRDTWTILTISVAKYVKIENGFECAFFVPK